MMLWIRENEGLVMELLAHAAASSRSYCSITRLSLAGELCPEVLPISKATMTDEQSQSAFLYYIHHLYTPSKGHLVSSSYSSENFEIFC